MLQTQLCRISILMLIGLLLFVLPATAAPRGESGTYHLGINKKLLAQDFKSYQQNAPALRRAAGIPDSIRADVLGQTQNFFAYNFSTGQYYSTAATLRKVGGHCYVYVENTQWNSRVTQANVETIASEFDNVIYPKVSAYFGSEWNPGIDNDVRITILLLDIQDGYLYTETYFTGYFSFLDEMPDIAAQQPPHKGRSNEREMFYMDVNPAVAASPAFHQTLAHEFQHMIHWHQNPNEEEWVDEGCSGLANYVAGYGVNLDQFNSFIADPLHTLMPFDGSLASYGINFSFLLYFMEQYGGDTETSRTNLIRKLVRSGDHGRNSYKSALNYAGFGDVSFNDLYNDFCTTIYLDTLRPTKYSIQGVDLWADPLFQHSGFPVRDRSWDVKPWSRVYVQFEAGSGETKVLKFLGADTGSFNLRMLLFNKDGTVTVQDVKLNADSDGFFDMHELGTIYSRAVMQLSFNGDSGPQSFRYNVGYAGPRSGIYPNPIFPDDIILTVESFIPPQVYVKRSGGSEEKVPMRYVTKGLYTGYYHVNYSGNYDVSIYGEDNEGLSGTIHTAFTVQKLHRYVLNMIAFNGSAAPIRLNVGTESAAEGTLLVHSAPQAMAGNLAAHGLEMLDGVSMSFAGTGTPEDTTITFATTSKPGRTGIVAIQGNRMQWLDGQQTEEGLTARVDEFVDYALVNDIAAPEVLSVQQQDGRIRIRLQEDGSGIDLEQSSLRVDGRQLELYAVGATELEALVAEHPQAAVLSISDRAGNRAERLLAVQRAPAPGELELWPNPVSTLLSLRLGTTLAGGRIRVLDSGGRRVVEGTPVAGFWQWNLTDGNQRPVANGTYLMEILDGAGKRQSTKFSVIR